MRFAGEARIADVDDMRKTGDAKRVTLLISLVHQQRIEERDEVVTMFCKSMAAGAQAGQGTSGGAAGGAPARKPNGWSECLLTPLQPRAQWPHATR